MDLGYCSVFPGQDAWRLLFVPLAVFPVGLQLFLLQCAAWQQVAMVFPFCILLEALSSASSVEYYFGSYISEKLMLLCLADAVQASCALPQALPFPWLWTPALGCVISICMFLLCHPFNLSSCCLFTLVVSLCGKRRAATDHQGDDLHCFDGSCQDISCRISPERGNMPSVQPSFWRCWEEVGKLFSSRLWCLS